MAYSIWTDDNSAEFSRSNENLEIERYAGSGDHSAITNSALSSGKFYWEIKLDDDGGQTNRIRIGICTSSLVLNTTQIGDTTTSYAYSANGQKYNNSTGTAYGSIYDTGAVIGIALDMDTGKIWFSNNGVWQDSGDPAAGTGEAFSSITGDMIAGITMYYYGSHATLRPKLSDLEYSAPDGFTAGLVDADGFPSEASLSSNFVLGCEISSSNGYFTIDNNFVLRSRIQVGSTQTNIEANFVLSSQLQGGTIDNGLLCNFVLGTDIDITNSNMIDSVISNFTLGCTVDMFSNNQDIAIGANFVLDNHVVIEMDNVLCGLPTFDDSRWS